MLVYFTILYLPENQFFLLRTRSPRIPHRMITRTAPITPPIIAKFTLKPLNNKMFLIDYACTHQASNTFLIEILEFYKHQKNYFQIYGLFRDKQAK